MKKTKLLTSLAALALVVGLGACEVNVDVGGDVNIGGDGTSSETGSEEESTSESTSEDNTTEDTSEDNTSSVEPPVTSIAELTFEVTLYVNGVADSCPDYGSLYYLGGFNGYIDEFGWSCNGDYVKLEETTNSKGEVAYSYTFTNVPVADDHEWNIVFYYDDEEVGASGSFSTHALVKYKNIEVKSDTVSGSTVEVSADLSTSIAEQFPDPKATLIESILSGALRLDSESLPSSWEAIHAEVKDVYAETEDSIYLTSKNDYLYGYWYSVDLDLETYTDKYYMDGILYEHEIDEDLETETYKSSETNSTYESIFEESETLDFFDVFEKAEGILDLDEGEKLDLDTLDYELNKQSNGYKLVIKESDQWADYTYTYVVDKDFNLIELGYISTDEEEGKEYSATSISVSSVEKQMNSFDIYYWEDPTELTIEGVLKKDYTNHKVEIKDCVVVGLFGNTLTVQQAPNGGSSVAWSIEVVANELPEDVALLTSVNVVGRLIENDVYRMIITDATVELESAEEHEYYILEDRYDIITSGAEDYYEYSGQIMDFYCELVYEDDVDDLDSWWGIEEEGYRCFYIEIYSDPSCVDDYDVFDGEIVIYEEESEEVKDFYDAFFDGTEQEVTLNGNTIPAGWQGIDEGDTFYVQSKIRLGDWYFVLSFDELETRTLSAIEEEPNVYNILTGEFDEEEVTFEGTLTDIHGSTLTVQNIFNGNGYCIEVECNDTPTDLKVTSLVSVSGTVNVDYSFAPNYAYYSDEPIRSIVNASVSLVLDEAQETAYFRNSAFFMDTDDPLYNSAYFDLPIEIVSKPDSWDKDGNDDLVIWSYTYVTYSSNTYRALSPLIVFGDNPQEVKDFWYAFFYGTDSDVTISSPYTGVGLNPIPVVNAGSIGMAVGDQFETLYAQYQLDYDIEVPSDIDQEDMIVAPISLGLLSALYITSVTTSGGAAG